VSKRINVNPDHDKVAGRERATTPAAPAPKTTAREEKMRARAEEKTRARNRRKGV